MSDEVRDWVFTFGVGQIHDGRLMTNRVVRIRGTYQSARSEMIDRFGLAWCGQYATEDEAGVAEFHLTEVTA